jgi:hypothetical protein
MVCYQQRMGGNRVCGGPGGGTFIAAPRQAVLVGRLSIDENGLATSSLFQLSHLQE